MFHHSHTSRLFLVISLALTLSACGSGGGHGVMTDNKPLSNGTTAAVLGVASSGMSAGMGNNYSSTSKTGYSTDRKITNVETAHHDLAMIIANQVMANQEQHDYLVENAGKQNTGITITISSSTLSCSGGGNVSYSGNMTISLSGSGSTFVIDYSMKMDETFNSCITKGSDGVTYTISGNMKIDTATGHFGLTLVDPILNSVISSSFHYPVTGTITISGGSTSYTNCAINVVSDEVLNGTISAPTGGVSWTGTVCGSSVDGSYTL